MATYGEVRFQLRKLIPDVDLELLDLWIQNRYQQILDFLPWQAVKRVTTLNVPAEYNTGSVNVTKGNANITGVGTSWTSGLSGRILHVGTNREYYSFGFVSASSAVLDRPYEGETASNVAYRLNQHVFVMPANARSIDSVLVTGQQLPLVRQTWDELNHLDPNFYTVGVPQVWAPYMLDVDGKLQIAVWPVPDELSGLIVSYTAEETIPNTTPATLLPWIRPACLIAGVQADYSLFVKDYNGANAHAQQFDRLLSELAGIHVEQHGGGAMRTERRWARHEARRYMR